MPSAILAVTLTLAFLAAPLRIELRRSRGSATCRSTRRPIRAGRSGGRPSSAARVTTVTSKARTSPFELVINLRTAKALGLTSRSPC
jgi:hypothetical protein